MTRSTRVQLSRLSLALVAAMAMAPAFAQSTSSGLTGVVTAANGQPVAGAEVTITHVESGTVSRATTDANGRYTARGLRVGGPYTVAVHSGAGDDTENGVYLPLDQLATVDAQVGVAGVTLDTVEVVATRAAAVFNPDNKGLGTNLNQRELKALPAPSRSIQDVARLDPRITITDRGDGSMSSMGQNSRYNSISVDGVGQGDPFGLNSNGMPYLGSPISVDTIEEYNLSTANYDVTSNVIGASINAVTKSGTNEFHGSVYYAYRNADDFVGDLNGKPYTAYDKDWTAGFTLGGPIVKDKLFFFVNYEKAETTAIGADSASALDPSLGNGASTSNKVSPGDLQRIIDAATALGLQPGSFSGSGTNLEDKRYLAKIDWNISDYHRASLTYQRTQETQPVVQGNSSTSVGLSSYWYTKNSDTRNTVLQFFDDWTENFSTEAKVSTSHFQQARSVDAQQPQVFINLGVDPNTGAVNGTTPYVDLGEDQFSHYNVLDVKTLRAYFAGTLYAGDHEIKGGFDYQRNKIYNLFGRTQFGAYTFWGIDNFENGIYNQFQIYQPAPGYTIGDVAAEWTLEQTGLFLQDTWQATENLSLQYGLRYDRADTGDSPVQNDCFASAPNPAGTGPANCKYGGFGFPNTNTIDGQSIVQPRFSFNYTLPDRKYKTQFRGGVGLFQSNPPTVWMTNPYQNNGITTATYTVFNNCALTPGNDFQTCGTSSVYLPEFSPDPFGQNIPPNASSQMNVDTISSDFKLPSAWKASFAWDQELPWWGTVFSAEWQVMKVKDAIYYENLNIGAPTGVLPDGRYTYYRDPSSGPVLIDPATGAVLIGSNGKTIGNGNRANANQGFSGSSTLLTNTDKGGAHSVTFSLKKPFKNGWYGNLGFTFGDATEVNPGTSSQASSNFGNNAWVNPNEQVASRSNYAIRRRVNAALTWEHKFFGDYSSGVGAFYDGHTGSPYSWVFGNDANGDSYSSDLVYVPMQNDPMVTFAPGTTSTQIQQFYDFIKGNDYLSGTQGHIARRNGASSPWINQLDLSFRQEIPGFFKGNKGEIRLDIFNFLNMLNSDWGQQQYVGFPYRRNLVNFQGVDSSGRMIYQLPTDKNGNYAPGSMITYDAGRDVKTNVVSRWSALLTLRYTF